MKKMLGFFLVVLCLFGCTKKESSISGALDLRKELQDGDGCSFRGTITAYYSDRYYEFVVDCVTSADGSVNFTLVAPETISGINGSISGRTGKLTFRDKALLFELQTNGQISPVEGPWLMMEAIRGGYIQSGAEIKGGYEYCIDDTFKSEEYRFNISVAENGAPTNCEIIWNNRRVLSIQISDYKDL